MTVYKIALVTIGRGGHTAYMIGDSKYSGTVDHPSKLSGYAMSIDDALADIDRLNRSDNNRDFYEFTDDALAVDLTAMDDGNLVTFAISGPMVNPFLPDNTVSGLSGTREWDGGRGELTGNLTVAGVLNEQGITAIMTSNDVEKAMEVVSKNPEGSIFGNAGSMDDVSRDVYVKLAKAFGAEVRNIGQ